MTHVLVIDDERPTLAMFELILQAMGYAPVAADSGEKGLEAFGKGEFPIVLTDIKMPGIDGMEVLARIKAARPATEVIVITGHGDVDLALAALNFKATDFIDKPISQRALSEALGRAMKRIKRRELAQPSASLRRVEGISVLDIAGDLSTGLEDLGAEIAATAGTSGLLITLSECASVNGAGISGLTRIIQERVAAGGKVALACRQENVRKVFEAAGITALASLFSSEEEGLRFFLETEA